MDGDESTTAPRHPSDSGGASLRVLFVCGADFRAPTEKVVLGYAAGLAEAGHQALIAVRGDPAGADQELGGARPSGLSIFSYRFHGPWLRPADRRRVARFRPDVVHAFNPRVDVIGAARRMNRRIGAPLVVHFEDDEWGLAAGGGQSFPRRLARRVAAGVSAVYPPAWRFASPRTLRWVASNAAGLDAITPALAEHVRLRLGRACTVLLPVRPAAGAPAVALAEPSLPGWLAGRDTVVFTGAVFSAHAADFRLLVEAIGELERRGRDVALVYAGMVASRFDLVEWARAAGLGERDFVALGYLGSAELQGLLRQATVLAQPGAPSEFNRLRLPSKLQAYLASGTPTVTFACGAGELFEDRREVLKTYGESAAELADRIGELLADPALRTELGRNGPVAAARLFDRERNCRALIDIYRQAIGEPASAVLDVGPR
jgi:glycosyltransferase involved in cell wall biosynthesis